MSISDSLKSMEGSYVHVFTYINKSLSIMKIYGELRKLDNFYTLKHIHIENSVYFTVEDVKDIVFSTIYI